MVNIFKKLLTPVAGLKHSNTEDEGTTVDADDQNDDLHRAYGIIMRHINAPPLEVETRVDDGVRERLLKRVETTWSMLGQEDAHWSVITDDRFHKTTLDDHLELFFEMGEGDIVRLESALNRVGSSLSEMNTVMDFGCGVGRLAIPVSKRAGRVLGVDISSEHLREAEGNIRKRGVENVAFRKISSVGEMGELGKFDLVLSLIVLQHNPPPVMREILEALCACVKHGGYLHIQVPTYRSNYRYNAAEDLADVSDKMEMHLLPQHVLLETIQAAGLTVLEVMEDGAAGSLDYRSQVVLSRRR